MPAETYRPDDDMPLYVISVAAQLSGMHAQTLRQYDRLGLVTPRRTGGGGRRYSTEDIERLREVQRLSQEGVSLSAIERLMAARIEAQELRRRVAELEREVARLQDQRYGTRVFAAGPTGDVIAVRAGERPRPPGRAVAVWQPWQGPQLIAWSPHHHGHPPQEEGDRNEQPGGASPPATAPRGTAQRHSTAAGAQPEDTTVAI